MMTNLINRKVNFLRVEPLLFHNLVVSILDTDLVTVQVTALVTVLDTGQHLINAHGNLLVTSGVVFTKLVVLPCYSL